MMTILPIWSEMPLRVNSRSHIIAIFPDIRTWGYRIVDVHFTSSQAPGLAWYQTQSNIFQCLKQQRVDWNLDRYFPGAFLHLSLLLPILHHELDHFGRSNPKNHQPRRNFKPMVSLRLPLHLRCFGDGDKDDH